MTCRVVFQKPWLTLIGLNLLYCKSLPSNATGMTRHVIILVFFSLVILLHSCSKKNSDPANQIQYIPARVLEHGSNIPLQGAEAIQNDCTRYGFGGCSQWESSSVFADAAGKLNFVQGKFRNHQVRNNNYWSFIDEPDKCSPTGLITCYQPADVTYFTSAGKLDSLVIKLFPITLVNVHVKNSGPVTEAVLYSRATIFGARGTPIQLRAGLDSSFQLPVFGNTQNHLSVFRKGSFNDTVAVQSRFIAKTDVLSLDFFY
jgi:hypothetical protein